MNCPTCHKLAIPESDLLTAQNLPEPSQVTYLHHQCPQHSYCYCGDPISHGSPLPPAATIVLHSGAPQIPTSPTTPTSPTPVSNCPTLPTIRDAVTVPAVNSQFTVRTECPGVFTVGGNVIIPGRGVLRVEDVDIDLKAVVVTNINVQANLAILAGTKVHALPSLVDLWRAFLLDTYEAEASDELSGDALLFLQGDGLRPIAPKANHYLVGKASQGQGAEYPQWELRPLSGMLALIAPGLAVGAVRVNRAVAVGNYTVAGTEQLTPGQVPTGSGLTVETVWISATFRNPVADAERVFGIGARSWEVRRASYFPIHIPIPFNGIGTIAITIPSGCAIHDIMITGYDVKVALPS